MCLRRHDTGRIRAFARVRPGFRMEVARIELASEGLQRVHLRACSLHFLLRPLDRGSDKHRDGLDRFGFRDLGLRSVGPHASLLK